MMNRTHNSALLNRSAFTTRPYQSSAVTVLTTLFHRFAESGEYSVFIQQAGAGSQRLQVRVQAGSGPLQRNIDLFNLDEETSECCPEQGGIDLQQGGVLGLYVSEGSGAYAVTIQRMGEREKQTLVDSQKYLPEGDLFSVTPIRPGDYKVTNNLTRTQMWLRVEMPAVPESPRPETGKRVERAARTNYTPAQPSLVRVSKEGFDPKEARVFAGQSVVFLFESQGNLTVELESVDDPGQPRRRIDRGSK